VRARRSRQLIGRPFARAVRAAAFALAVLTLTVSRSSYAEDVPVPVSLQAELLAKVAGYDKNLKARAGDRVRILLVEQPGNAESERIVTQMRAALEQVGPIAGMAHEEAVVPFSGAAALVATIRDRHAAIVFFSPGFAADIGAVRDALDGVDVMSATAVPDYVPRGVVLGFDLVGGKPKLTVNLSQARRQNVSFAAEVLKIAKVYE